MKPHPKNCQCGPCVISKVKAFMDRIHDTSRVVPETLDQTVPVRAHWRRHPKHLAKFPKLRAALLAELRAARKKTGS